MTFQKVLSTQKGGHALNFATGFRPHHAGMYYLDTSAGEVLYSFPHVKTGMIHAMNAMARNGVQ